MLLGDDGLPISLVDNAGTSASFSNYTDSTVDITFFDSNDNLIGGPITVEINPKILSEYLFIQNSLTISDNPVATNNGPVIVTTGTLVTFPVVTESIKNST